MKFSQLICCITILLCLSAPCFAQNFIDDKVLPNGNIEVHINRYKYYINKMTNDTAELKKLRPLNMSFKKIIDVQEKQINLFTINEDSFKQEISLHERINKQQEDYIKWADHRITAKDKEILHLESRPEGFWKRTKDMLFWPMLGLALGSLSQQLNK